MREPVGLLGGECKVVWVPPRKTVQVVGVEVAGPCQVAWEVRVCYAEFTYECVFIAAETKAEVVIEAPAADVVSAASGVRHGIWDAPAAGMVVARLKNPCA